MMTTMITVKEQAAPQTVEKSDNVIADTSCCGSACKSKCNKHYIGRGYLQTTWLKNYQLAKDGGCTKDESGNSVDIVKNPEKVASDTALAWCTSAVFWKREVHDDRCKGTTASKTTCDLGNTISAINGDQECDYEQTSRRLTVSPHRIVSVTLL